MKSTAILAVLFAAAVAAPAFAADYNDAKAVCAAALAEKAGKTLEGATTRLVKARSGASVKLTIATTFADGAKLKGECRVRGDEVLEAVISD